jgi:hypothetical protein
MGIARSASFVFIYQKMFMKKSWMLVAGILLTAVVNAQKTVKINECVISNGVLKVIEVDYDPATGNKTVMVNNVKTPFEKAYDNKKDYAEGTTWFMNNEEVKLGAQTYVKYGLPRVLGVNEIQKSSTYQGVNVYVEAGFTGVAEVIYIPVRRGCEFQPYQIKVPECGTVTIKPNVKEVKAGKDVSFTATVTGAKQPLTYSWSIFPSDTKGATNKKTVVATTTKGAAGLTLTATVTVTGKGCVSYKDASIKIVQ